MKKTRVNSINYCVCKVKVGETCKKHQSMKSYRKQSSAKKREKISLSQGAEQLKKPRSTLSVCACGKMHNDIPLKANSLRMGEIVGECVAPQIHPDTPTKILKKKIFLRLKKFAGAWLLNPTNFNLSIIFLKKISWNWGWISRTRCKLHNYAQNLKVY